jgi:3-oxoacyl-[acyl-carrier protein] reductase
MAAGRHADFSSIDKRLNRGEATMARLADKVAVVTGGTQGIGRGVVLRFLKEGARVVYCSRNPRNNEAMVDLIGAIGAAARAKYVAADVGVKEQIQGVVHDAVKTFGRVDIVVNNAQGIAPLKPIMDKPDQDYAMTLATGFYHSLWTMKAAVPYMRQQGGGGSFINFSSHWAQSGMLYSSDYNITKAANEALTRSAANEWGKYAINVNCIVPAGDSFAYRAYASMNPGIHETICAAIPMRRMGDCEIDIAGAILGLVSRNGRFITGQTFYVDGGAWLARPPNEHAPDTDIHAGRHQTATGV